MRWGVGLVGGRDERENVIRGTCQEGQPGAVTLMHTQGRERGGISISLSYKGEAGIPSTKETAV